MTGAGRPLSSAAVSSQVPFGRRLALALRVLFDGALAARWESAQAAALPAPSAEPPPRDLGPALQLLALLQRDGRLVDFLQQPIDTFTDAEVGAAARVVHQGCRRGLAALVALEPVRVEAEGARVSVSGGELAEGAVRLVGAVTGEPPFSGTLRHPGWRARGLRLPQPVTGASPEVLAPAEVEVP